MTDADRFHRIDRIFQSVCDLTPPEQAEALDRLAPADASLREEVVDLLRIDSGGAAISGSASLPEIFGAALGDQADPSSVGGFEILTRLGAGGMGIVYKARQASPRREVAIKLLRPGLLTPERIRRFEFESELLARLRDPRIASVYQAGVANTASGPRPYYAMELVEGRTLDAWVAETTPTQRRRLEVFAEICEAVHHAHAKGVIHRDLKPKNVMVTPDGVPKVLDFGVARVVDAADDGGSGITRSIHTGSGQLLGTLEYMSPEQVSGDPMSMDARSDVFALGVILFELLSGSTPHDLAGLGLPSAIRMIAESDAPRLSSRNPEIGSELESVTAKALALDPDDRYDSAAAMASDVRRYLRDEPVLAAPASTIYQLRKFARRNRTLVAGAGLAAVALLLSTVVSTAFAVRESAARRVAAAERERTEEQQEVTREVLGFLNGELLSAMAPFEFGPDATVRQVIDRAAERLEEGRFKDRPRVRAAVLGSLGSAYANAGELAAGEHLTRESLRLLESTLGSDDRRVIETASTLATILRHARRYDEAVVFDRRVYDHAVATHGTAHPDTALAANELAQSLSKLGRHEQAERLYLESLRYNERKEGPDAFGTRIVTGNLIGLYAEMDRHREAIPLARALLESQRRTAGPDHLNTLWTMNNLASLLGSTGEYAEALPMLERVVAGRTEAWGRDNHNTLSAMQNLGRLYRMAGRHDRAEAMLTETLERSSVLLGDADLRTLNALRDLARLRSEQGRTQEADRLFARLVETAAGAWPGQHIEVVRARLAFAEHLVALRRLDKAEPILIEAHEGAKAGTRSVMPLAIEAADLLARVAAAREDAPDRERWLVAKADAARAVIDAATRGGSQSPKRLADARISLAEALSEVGRCEDATRVLLAVMEPLPADAPTRIKAQKLLDGLRKRHED